MTFAPSDFLSITSLVFLEGLLSADNALVIALLVRHLGPKQQQKALWIGLAMAFGLRSIGIGLASYLIGLWWVCGLGACYLLFLTIKHFISKAKGEGGLPDDVQEMESHKGFGITIVQIAITDLFFAIDSILVAVALVPNRSKIWIVYLGGFLGMLLLRVTAQILIGLVKKYPSLDNVAYLLVGWAGVKLGFEALHLFGLSQHQHLPSMPEAVFWPVFGILVVAGAVDAVRRGPSAGPTIDETAMVDGSAGIPVTDDGAAVDVPDSH